MVKPYISVNTKRAIAKNTKRIFVKIIMLVLLLGFSYVILYPLLFKLSAAFMSKDDLYDAMVNLVPRNWTFDNFKAILGMDDIGTAFLRTAVYALLVGICATASAAFVGYGLAKFRFPGHNLVVALVILTMVVPSQTIQLSLFSTFRYFDVFGLIKLITGSSIQLTNTPWPFVILAATSLGFRAGIFVILMLQYFKGVPKELHEAAYVDGSGPFYTFFKIILPMSRSMLIVVFVLAFSWQWTDVFYTGMLHGGSPILSNMILTIASVDTGSTSDYYYYIVQANTAALMAIIPLLIIYVLLQRKIIQGIESSGLVG